jgi:hypothetical protein
MLRIIGASFNPHGYLLSADFMSDLPLGSSFFAAYLASAPCFGHLYFSTARKTIQ